jgi:hypothetical protein
MFLGLGNVGERTIDFTDSYHIIYQYTVGADGMDFDGLPET